MARGTTRLAVVLHMIENQPWSGRVVRDIQSVLAHEPLIKAEFADPHGDVDAQLGFLEQYLRDRIDPQPVRAPLAKSRASGVPVIVIGSEIGDPDLYRALVVGDNRQFGREVGTFFAKVMDGVGDLVEILGPTAYTTPADRSAGFR